MAAESYCYLLTYCTCMTQKNTKTLKAELMTSVRDIEGVRESEEKENESRTSKRNNRTGVTTINTSILLALSFYAVT